MKSLLLLSTLLFAFIGLAQNVDDQKLSFQYTQLPSIPLGTDVYQVEVDHSLYQKANEDSLSAYEVQLNLAETMLTSWIEQKQKIDQAHLLEMAKWQKAVNSGQIIAEPIKAPYPPMPMLKEEIPAPILTKDIDLSTVTNGVTLVGLTQGAGGAKVTITFHGFQDAKFIMKKTGSAATTKYNYSASYKMPANVKVEVPGKGIVLNEDVMMGDRTKNINTYASEYEFDYWKIDNLNTFWDATQTEALNALLNEITNVLNNSCAFPVKNYATEIYTVKKFKDHDYSDLIDAFTKAKLGYMDINADLDRNEASGNLNSAIAMWEQTLTESNTADKKSRINEKVTALLYYNLAEAYMWKNEFDTAQKYIEQAKNGGVGKYKKEANRLQFMLNELKTRYEANA